MNKMFLVFALMFVSVFSFAADSNNQKYIDQLDGDNWMAAPAATKYDFIAGWMNANRAALDAFYDKIDENNKAAGYTGVALEDKNDEAIARFESFFIYAQGVGDIITMLDNFYRDSDNRHFYVWSVIVDLCGKTLD